MIKIINGKEIGRIINASENKVFKLKGHTDIMGDTISTGYIYYADGIKLDNPIFLCEETVEEIDKPKE